MSIDQLRLYIDIPPNEQADLEVVARASLAVLSAVREISSFIDPFSEASLVIVDADKGSLWVNTKITLKSYLGDPKKTAAAVLLTAIGWMAYEARDFAAGKIADHIWNNVFGKDAAGLSEDDRKEIASIVAKTIEAKIGQKPTQEVFAELESDPVVKGATVTGSNKEVPDYVVPRSEFRRRSGYGPADQQILRRRTTTEPATVTLISPVLELGNRRWKFRIGKSEFGAPIKDVGFLEAVLSGNISIVMKSGVQLTVLLETVEEYKNGAWTPVDRTVLRVLGLPTQAGGRQGSLFSRKQDD